MGKYFLLESYHSIKCHWALWRRAGNCEGEGRLGLKKPKAWGKWQSLVRVQAHWLNVVGAQISWVRSNALSTLAKGRWGAISWWTWLYLLVPGTEMIHPKASLRGRLVRPSRHVTASASCCTAEAFQAPSDHLDCPRHCQHMHGRAFAHRCFSDPVTSIQNILQSCYCPEHLTLTRPLVNDLTSPRWQPRLPGNPCSGNAR